MKRNNTLSISHLLPIKDLHMKKLTLFILTIISLHYTGIHAMTTNTVIDMSQFTQETQAQSSNNFPGQVPDQAPDVVVNMNNLTQATTGHSSPRNLGHTEVTPRTREITSTIEQGGASILERVSAGETSIVQIATATINTLTKMDTDLTAMQEVQRKQWIANRFSLLVTALGAGSIIINFILARIQ